MSCGALWKRWGLMRLSISTRSTVRNTKTVSASTLTKSWHAGVMAPQRFSSTVQCFLVTTELFWLKKSYGEKRKDRIKESQRAENQKPDFCLFLRLRTPDSGQTYPAHPHFCLLAAT